MDYKLYPWYPLGARVGFVLLLGWLGFALGNTFHGDGTFLALFFVSLFAIFWDEVKP